jgi:CelD/BcsL family acetyltransferase involved in cellulose biosynthesis
MSLARMRHAPVDLTVVDDPAMLAALKPAWQSLWFACPGATPFQSPQWLLPWWDVFAPGCLQVIAVHEAGVLTGLAPLYRDGSRLRPLGVSLSDYQDILTLPGSQAVAAMGEAIAAMDASHDCRFDEVAPSADVLRLAIPGWKEHLERASTCPQVALSGGIKAAVPRSTLRLLRTAQNRAARQRDCVILEGDADNALPLIGELQRLNRLRHADSVFADPRVADFHTAAMPGLVELGVVRLYALTIAETVAAVYYGLLHRDRAYAYLSGFDPAFAYESPSAILLGYAIESAVREGAQVFDFLRGSEGYKYRWGAQDHFNMRWIATRQNG